MENSAFTLKNIRHSWLQKEILSIDHLVVQTGDRIGIVGGNGQGKSTLLNLINGSFLPDEGTVVRKIDYSYHPQLILPLEKENNGAAELARKADLIPIENASTDNELDGVLLSRFSVPSLTDMDNLSGGEAAKYRLVKQLSYYKEGMLLDEPTTHLDRQSISELIDELRYYYGTLIFVSHDRSFLNELATKIWEVADGKVTEYAGNYDDYMRQKEQQLLEQENAFDSYQKEQKRLTAAISKKKQQIQRTQKVTEKKSQLKIQPSRLSSSKQKDTVQKNLQKSAKAMETRLEQLKPAVESKKKTKIAFPVKKQLELHNRFPIIAENLRLSFAEKIIADNLSFQVPLEKRIALTGKNGAGKTTLLKAIIHREKGIRVSSKAVFGIYEQMEYCFTSKEPLLQFLAKETELSEAILRSMLHNLGFSQNDLAKSMATLSGGEATKVAIARTFIRPTNILLLDEPTNFIDLSTIEALEMFIKAYQGTILFTSHDTSFIQNVAQEQWQLEGGKIIY